MSVITSLPFTVQGPGTAAQHIPGKNLPRGWVIHAEAIRVTESEPRKNHSNGILQCEGVGQLISCSLPGSSRSQWITPLHKTAHNLTPHPQSKTTHDYQVTRFCNCSSIINCNVYFLLDSYLDPGGAGVSSQFRDELSSAGLPKCIPTEPKGAGLRTGKHPAWGQNLGFFCEALGPSAGCLL